MKFFKLLVFISLGSLGLFLLSRPANILSPVANLPTSTPRPKIEVKIDDVVVTVTLAQTAEETSLGLGGVSHLDDNEGMLFDFSRTAAPTAFWMKGMLIPIDIIWIKDNKVIQIDASAAPEPEVPDNQLKLYIPKERAVQYVLEVNAGFSESNDISVGSSFTLTSQE